jgi:hypothetical protein
MRTLTIPSLATIILLAGVGGAFARQGTAQAPVSSLRVVSSASGSTGEVREGRYVILDPRTTFRVPGDTKVVVSFQWIGTPGKHHFQGIWRGPGDVSSSSGFDYVAATREFGAYWQLVLSADVPRGAWKLDALVDGQPAGTHNFEIVAGDGSATAVTPSKPIPLTRQELYARALGATVTVDAIDETGHTIHSGAGGLIDAQTAVTSFNSINGAARLRVRPAQGAAVEVTDISACDARQNWTLLHVTGLTGTQPAPPTTVQPIVGAICSSVSATGEGAYVVTPGEVVGVHDYPGFGTRLNISFNAGDAAPGALVLDEFGATVGMATAGLYPGVARIFTVGETMTQSNQMLVLPIANVQSQAASAPIALAELKAKGFFMAQVTLDRQVMSAGFATGVLRDGARTQPIDQRDHFARQEKKVAVFVNWDPKESLKGMLTLHIYDSDNRQLGETKPMKVNLRVGQISMSSWDFSVPSVNGMYRVDVLVDASVAWRGYFRVMD